MSIRVKTKRSLVIVSKFAYLSKYKYRKMSVRVNYPAAKQQQLKPGSVSELNSGTLWTGLVLVPNVRLNLSATLLRVRNNLRPFALQGM